MCVWRRGSEMKVGLVVRREVLGEKKKPKRVLKIEKEETYVFYLSGGYPLRIALLPYGFAHGY